VIYRKLKKTQSRSKIGQNEKMKHFFGGPEHQLLVVLDPQTHIPIESSVSQLSIGTWVWGSKINGKELRNFFLDLSKDIAKNHSRQCFLL